MSPNTPKSVFAYTANIVALGWDGYRSGAVVFLGGKRQRKGGNVNISAC